MDKSRLFLTSFFAKPSIQIFLLGILVGMGIGLLIMVQHHRDQYSYYYYNPPQAPNVYFDYVGEHSVNDTHHRMIDTSLADELYHKVRILCWVMTCPKNHLIKAVHVKATWGKRCNKLLFMSTEEDPILPSVGLPGVEDRAHLWGKTKEAIKYIYKHYYGHYDWFFKADDDTYTVMENMRYMLYYMNSSEAIYYGCRLKMPQQGTDYMSGGAGYVLSKEAVKKFVLEALPNTTICKEQNTGNEDVEIANCLQNVGVKLGNSLDDEDRNRFTPVFVNEMLIPGILNNVKWYTKMMYSPYKLGLTCCSDNLITTHYVSPHQMYLLEYLIYHVTPFGRAYHPVLANSTKKHGTEMYNNYHFRGASGPLEWEDYE